MTTTDNTSFELIEEEHIDDKILNYVKDNPNSCVREISTGINDSYLRTATRIRKLRRWNKLKASIDKDKTDLGPKPIVYSII